MSGPWKRLSSFSSRTLRLAVLVAIVSIVFVACATDRASRYPCVSSDPGIRGEVMRTAEGKTLYFNGQCWTAQAMPPTDTPLLRASQ
jgi:hypothetical protein